MVNLNMEYQHIIWDWNGTLLNDVEIVVEAMNLLLNKRSLPLLEIERYKEIFTFPVKEYYYKLGYDFDKEPFEMLAAEFISEYTSEKYRFKLFNGVEDVITDINTAGFKQYILSASRQEALEHEINKFGIESFFNKIVGLDNHYAASKVDAGISLMNNLKLKPEGVLLIGDTLHDFEVSEALGCKCLLVSNGHQSYERLTQSKAYIIKDISEVVPFLQNINA